MYYPSKGLGSVHLAKSQFTLDRCRAKQLANAQSGASMFELIIADLLLTTWFFEAWAEVVRSFRSMSVTQWGVVSASVVAFGFLCLRGNGIRHY